VCVWRKDKGERERSKGTAAGVLFFWSI